MIIHILKTEKSLYIIIIVITSNASNVWMIFSWNRHHHFTNIYHFYPFLSFASIKNHRFICWFEESDLWNWCLTKRNTNEIYCFSFSIRHFIFLILNQHVNRYNVLIWNKNNKTTLHHENLTCNPTPFCTGVNGDTFSCKSKQRLRLSCNRLAKR